MKLLLYGQHEACLSLYCIHLIPNSLFFFSSFQYFCYVFCNLAVFKKQTNNTFSPIQTFRIFATTITLFRCNIFCIFSVIIDIQRTEIFHKTMKHKTTKRTFRLALFCWAACFDCVAIHRFILLCGRGCAACRTSSFAYLRYKLSLCN